MQHHLIIEITFRARHRNINQNAIEPSYSISRTRERSPPARTLLRRGLGYGSAYQSSALVRRVCRRARENLGNFLAKSEAAGGHGVTAVLHNSISGRRAHTESKSTSRARDGVETRAADPSSFNPLSAPFGRRFAPHDAITLAWSLNRLKIWPTAAVVHDIIRQFVGIVRRPPLIKKRAATCHSLFINREPRPPGGAPVGFIKTSVRESDSLTRR